LKAGKSIAQGAPESVINEELLKELYGVELDIVEVKGKPFVYMA
ncbi:MAG: ABC transporter ATP-binding protein, partial [[Eubacterium] sulci]|nr:ABC transporter ATP-binding protein [[Eubacterium] sulci]